MACISISAWMVAAALAGGAASADTIHENDSIGFEGTIRRTLSDAAVCNVLEGGARGGGTGNCVPTRVGCCTCGGETSRPATATDEVGAPEAFTCKRIRAAIDSCMSAMY